jgi:hypothetical protein
MGGQARRDAGLARGRLAQARGSTQPMKICCTSSADAGALQRGAHGRRAQSVAFTGLSAPWKPPMGVRA